MKGRVLKVFYQDEETTILETAIHASRKEERLIQFTEESKELSNLHNKIERLNQFMIIYERKCETNDCRVVSENKCLINDLVNKQLGTDNYLSIFSKGRTHQGN